ncbi:MAG TPA: protein kinase, partial [Woeseiaceae bacterium]|nr:protein kinase [Woeseiaceae bacterium]
MSNQTMRVLNEGTRLADRYTLVRRLGSGGMSEVWLARDERAQQRVALKFLSPGLVAQAEARSRFHREWQAANRLMHAHIARVFEYHDDPDGPFYSQQFVDGPDISAVTGQPPDECLRPLALVADALRYAHAKGFVHRDIKASNILLDNRGAPYLIDFGVAQVEGIPTAGGSPIGMSPQQRAGEGPVPADDIWALGVLMHELLSGEPPPADADVAAVLTAADGSRIPEELQRIVRDALALDASERPTAEEVVERLRDAGVTPGPASIKRRAAYAGDTEISAEAVTSIRPVRPEVVATGKTGQAETRGVSPKIAYGGLAVLLVVFVTVIFWLPDAIQDGAEPAGDRPAASAGAADTPPGDVAPTVDEGERDVDPAAEAELKSATDEALGDLLSRLQRLQYRGIEHWGGQTYLNALGVYEQGDRAYLNKDYATAGDLYREAAEMLEPFFDRIDGVFNETMQAARDAFAAGDHAEAVRLYDLAVAITPGHREAEEGLARARNLSSVLELVDRGRTFENELDLQAAKLAFEKALELDPAWEPALSGLERVNAAIHERSFQQRMTEGLDALAAGDLLTARAAFDAAKALKPDSPEPADGLLQVDQEMRLANIGRLEQEAVTLEDNEEWQAAIAKYQEIGEIDSDLQFVREGLARARERA